jgi:hypothetical protein
MTHYSHLPAAPIRIALSFGRDRASERTKGFHHPESLDNPDYVGTSNAHDWLAIASNHSSVRKNGGAVSNGRATPPN